MGAAIFTQGAQSDTLAFRDPGTAALAADQLPCSCKHMFPSTENFIKAWRMIHADRVRQADMITQVTSNADLRGEGK